jgi:hypothetical protein
MSQMAARIGMQNQIWSMQEMKGLREVVWAILSQIQGQKAHG